MDDFSVKNTKNETKKSDPTKNAPQDDNKSLPNMKDSLNSAENVIKEEKIDKTVK